jgi:hypothetical protein
VAESIICPGFPTSREFINVLASQVTVPWCLVPRSFVLVTIRPKCSSPMDCHLALPISGSWSPGAARAVDGVSLLHGPLRVDRNAETKKKMDRWTKGRGTKRQGTPSDEPSAHHMPLPPSSVHTPGMKIYQSGFPEILKIKQGNSLLYLSLYRHCTYKCKSNIFSPLIKKIIILWKDSCLLWLFILNSRSSLS